uniref:Heterochromatin protein 1 n=1 Tax=Aceria tosichella TaxID=561515 RepID=A0A6G1SHP4_9ACAR
MSDEDLSVVGEVLERVITKTVSQEGNKEEGEEDEAEVVGVEGGGHDREEQREGFKTDTNSPVTPLSLDYGDDDERPDGFLEGHQNNIANGNHDDKATSNDEDVLMAEVNGRYENGGDTAVGVDVGNDDDDDINGPPEYVVEKIVEKRMGADGSVKYQVKWKNYPSSSNTWEPVENLADCDKVMQQFEIRSAEKLAERHTSEEDEQIQTGHPEKTTATKRKQKSPPKEYEVNDVMGLTMVGDEKYFLVSLSNSTQKTFIRASLANRIVPQKVIDFYIKSMRWKSTTS